MKTVKFLRLGAVQTVTSLLDWVCVAIHEERCGRCVFHHRSKPCVLLAFRAAPIDLGEARCLVGEQTGCEKPDLL